MAILEMIYFLLMQAREEVIVKMLMRKLIYWKNGDK